MEGKWASEDVTLIPWGKEFWIYFLNKIGKKPDQKLEKFIIKLNTASIATRYPDDLAKIQSAYTEEITKEMIEKSKDVLKWVKTQF